MDLIHDGSKTHLSFSFRLPLALFLPLCLFLCPSLSVSVCLCRSLSVSVCLCLSLSVSVCLCLSLSVSVCLCLDTGSLATSRGLQVGVVTARTPEVGRPEAQASAATCLCSRSHTGTHHVHYLQQPQLIEQALLSPSPHGQGYLHCVVHGCMVSRLI